MGKEVGNFLEGIKVEDLTGMKFENLEVIGFDYGRYEKDKIRVHKNEIKQARSYWVCGCDCGNTISVSSDKLKNGDKKNCGCKKTNTSSFSYEKVKKIIETTGCTLLSEAYINNAAPLNIRCKCGDIFTTTLKNFNARNKKQCDNCGELKRKINLRNKDRQERFNDGRFCPCDHCSKEDIKECMDCKTYSYFKRNKRILVDNWSGLEYIIVIDSILNNKVGCLNDILLELNNKTLDDLVLLLTEHLVTCCENNSTKIKVECAGCGKIMYRSKWEYNKERVYCSMKCRDEIRAKLYTRESSITYRNNPEKLENKLCELKNISKSKGYDLIDTVYVNNRTKMTLLDINGYLYESSSYDIENGIFNRMFSKNNKYSLDNIKRYIELNNLKCKLLEDVYQNNTTPMLFECECGRTYKTSLSGFKSGKVTCNKCSGSHKWDYESISTFIKENSTCTLLSRKDDITTCNSKIVLECGCGEIFTVVFANFERYGKVCENCRIKETRKHDIEYVKDEYRNHGLIPMFDVYSGYNERHTCVNDEGYKVSVSLGNLVGNKSASVFGNGNPHTRENIIKWLSLYEPTYNLLEKKVDSCRDKIMFECGKGHKYRTNWTNFQMGKRCPICKNESIRKALSNDIDTFKKYVSESTNDEYECISNEYINSATKVKFIHKECGREFSATPGKFTGCKNRNGSRCPSCQSELTESVHATVLKQLFERYKDDVIIEDPSCINPLTGLPLPTDIVCYSEKIAIEVQSWFHDREYQKVKDEIKRNYWEAKGFTVYSPDVREYSSLSMAKIFFKDMTELPDWLDYKYGKKQIDIRKVQDLLNEYKSTKEIGKEFGVKRHVIQRLIDNGEVSIKEDHWKVLKNVKKVCQLSLDGDLLEIYDNATIASIKTGVHQTYISSAVRSIDNSNYYKGFLWVSEDNFNSGNYIVGRLKERVVKKNIVQLTLDYELVKEYVSIREAANELNFGRDYISKCINGKKEGYKGYKWMYKDDYEEYLKQNKN